MNESPSETTSWNDQELERSMYVVTELVGMLKRSWGDRRQIAEIEEEISAVARYLEFLIEEYEYNLSDITTRPDLIKLGSRPRCPDCVKRALEDRRVIKPVQTTLVRRPSWQLAFEFAFARTGLVVREFIEHCGTSTVEGFPLCLMALRCALWRLQRFLPRTAIPDVTIGVEEPSRHCADCGKQIEDEVEQK